MCQVWSAVQCHLEDCLQKGQSNEICYLYFQYGDTAPEHYLSYSIIYLIMNEDCWKLYMVHRYIQTIIIHWITNNALVKYKPLWCLLILFPFKLRCLRLERLDTDGGNDVNLFMDKSRVRRILLMDDKSGTWNYRIYFIFLIPYWIQCSILSIIFIYNIWQWHLMDGKCHFQHCNEVSTRVLNILQGWPNPGSRATGGSLAGPV